MGRKKKFKYYILPAILLLVGSLFLLNLYLTKHLEQFLKKELIQRTADATDGFYTLSFDKLAINFFNGELKIEGIVLEPDSEVFRDWQQKDSLPAMYLSARVGVIDFKGLNLTWRWSYKQLHFHSFEVKQPEVKVFQSSNSSRTEKKEDTQAQTKTLYEVISPYINVLSVQTLNLDNASVSYTVENPLSPIVYALTNVSFHAYGFRLDENSSDSGKLLYCDNFDFETNQPQLLLANNDFTLNTDSIMLSTEDSVIYISDINLQPQDTLWKARKQKPDRFLDAFVKTVEVQGVAFRREKALNYLAADAFTISSPDINVYSFVNENHRRKEKTKATPVTKIDADSLVRALSLYEIISPILHSVAVQTIGIRQAKMQYSYAVKDSVEVYKLANLDFKANGFRVDSLSEVEHGFWYSRSFAFEAIGIEGRMSARNHRLNIKRMALDTEKGDFRIEGIALHPLSTKTRNDYMSGTIDTVSFTGLVYDNGISAEQFKIDRPNLHYVVAAAYWKADKENKPAKPAGNSHIDVESILNPFFRYLSVKKVSLNSADFEWDDRKAADPVSYTLKNFNFFATDILVDERTGKKRGWLFDYGNMGFNFSHFDNYLPGKTYRLSIGKGNFSTVKGILSLHDIKLTPQDSLWEKAPDTYFRASVPALHVTGLKRLPENPLHHLSLGTLQVDSPDIQMFKDEQLNLSVLLDKFEVDKIAWKDSSLHLGAISLLNPSVSYQPVQPKRKEKETVSKPASLDIYHLLSPVAGRISLEKFDLSNAKVDYAFCGKGHTLEYQRLDTVNLVLKGLMVDNRERLFKLDDIRFSTRNLVFPLDNGFYTLKVGHVAIDNTDLKVENLRFFSPYPKMEFAYLQPQHKDWFDVSVGNLSLSNIDIPALVSDKALRIEEVQVKDAVLGNFKNQKIAVPRRIVPMVYEALQKAPLQIDIRKLGVNNFSVVYEELSKKGTVPGKLFFTDMNGTFTGLTNIVSYPEQYIRLDADGKFMGNGGFTATWMLPVDSLNDCFLLTARMSDFDLTALNELITPLALAQVESGHLKDFTFSTEATSKDATVDMLFLYSDLRAVLLKEKDGEVTDKKFLTGLVNRILKHNNPDKTKRGFNKPRHSNVTIIRDPYHSTFNYLWQILRPALVESVGVSKKKQDMAQNVMTFFKKVKNFFHKKKKEPKEALPEANDQNQLFLEFEPIK